MMSILILVEYELEKIAADAIRLPDTVTARHPKIRVSNATIGPNNT